MKILDFWFNTLDKGRIYHRIDNEVKFSLQYFSMLFLSIIICALGLIIGNNAIIIGAMLISPLLWPIIGLSLATVKNQNHLMRRSAGLLAVSLAVIVLTSFLISLISPFREVNYEILSRINPTIFDLIIALAAGLAGTLILVWPQFSDALAGVAISASLLPPITVTGIGFAFARSDIAYGSFILFLTNLASIIFAGIIIFSLARFYSHHDEEYVKRMSIGLVVSVLVIIAVGFQLFFSLKSILYENRINQQVRNLLTKSLKDISSEISVEHVKVDIFNKQDLLKVQADVKAPGNVLITVNQKNNIVALLSKSLHQNIDLSLRITQIIEAVKPNKFSIQEKKYKSKIEKIITQYAKKISPEVEVSNLDVKMDLNEPKVFKIKTLWRAPEYIKISYLDRELLLNQLIKDLQSFVDLDLEMVRYYKITQTPKFEDPIYFTKNLLKDKVDSFMQKNHGVFNIFYKYTVVNYDEKTNGFNIIIVVDSVDKKSLPINLIDTLKKELSIVFSPVEKLQIRFAFINYTIL